MNKVPIEQKLVTTNQERFIASTLSECSLTEGTVADLALDSPCAHFFKVSPLPFALYFLSVFLGLLQKNVHFFGPPWRQIGRVCSILT